MSSKYVKFGSICQSQQLMETDNTVFISPDNSIYNFKQTETQIINPNNVDTKNCNLNPSYPGTNKCVKTCK